MFQSSRTRFMFLTSLRRAMASWPFSASYTSNPSCLSCFAMMLRMDLESSTTRARMVPLPSRARGAPSRLARGLQVALVTAPERGGFAGSNGPVRSRHLLRITVRIAEAKRQLPKLGREPRQLLGGLLGVLGASGRVLGDLRDLDDPGADLVAPARRLAQVPSDLARGGQLLLDGRGDRVGDVLDLLDRVADLPDRVDGGARVGLDGLDLGADVLGRRGGLHR